MKYGYARVSASDQNLDRQLDLLVKNGVDSDKIYCDKKSGKDFCRENYARLCKKLKAGDVLVVASIDRLGRNYDMILTEWMKITKEIGADVVVLDMPLLDTREKEDDLTGRLIADIVLQLLSYVAQTERENIKARQREGIDSALARGVQFGRPAVTTPQNFESTAFSYKNGEITIDEALEITGMKRSTFYSRLKVLDI